MSAETPAKSSAGSLPEPTPLTSPGSEGENASSALQVRSDSEVQPTANPRALASDSPLFALPMQLDVTVPIRSFRVENLLALENGSVLESRWHHGDDVPVWCGGAQLAWTEFEVVDQKLAVRITRIS